MSLKPFIKKVCKQPAVYWEYQGANGYGGTSFADPVQIYVRWDEKTEIVTGNDGIQFVSDSQVLTPNDLKEQSYLVLGLLEDIDGSEKPENIDGAAEIRNMDRSPEFGSTTFDVFVAHLGGG